MPLKRPFWKRWLWQLAAVVTLMLGIWLILAQSSEEPQPDLKPTYESGQMYYLHEPYPHTATDLPRTLAYSIDQWQAMSSGQSLGYQAEPIWFRQYLHSPIETPSHTDPASWRLVLDNPILDKVELYWRMVYKDKTTSRWLFAYLGDSLPFDHRQTQTTHFAITLHNPNSIDQTPIGVEWIAKITTTGTMKLNVKLLNQNAFEKYQQHTHLFYGVYIGLVMCCLIYNFFNWLIFREEIYPWYLLWVVHFAMFSLTLEGLTFRYLWPNNVSWQEFSTIYLLGAASAFGNASFMSLLRRIMILPWWGRHYAIEWLIVYVTVWCFMALSYQIGIQLVLTYSAFLLLRVFILMVIATLQGQMYVQQIMIFSLPIALGSFILIFQRVGWIPIIGLTEYLSFIISGGEVIFFALSRDSLLHSKRRLTQAAHISAMNDDLLTMNQALKASKAQLEDQNKTLIRLQEQFKIDAHQRDLARTQFLANAAHDLRQPLQAIGMVIPPIKHEIQAYSNVQLHHLVDLADRAVNGMREQLLGLLDFTRLESGTVPVHLKALPIRELVENVLLMANDLAKRQQVRLKSQVSPSYWVKSDESLLIRILQNLVSNAIKYADQKKKTGRFVYINCKITDSYLFLNITDNGIGMAMEHWKSGDIYQPYFQIKNQLPEDLKGVGLGLSIVQSAMKRLPDHVLNVHSELGIGSTFQLQIPLCEPPIEAISASHLTPNQTILEFLTKKHILIIEDDPLVNHAVSALLRSLNIQNTTLASYSELEAWFIPPHPTPPPDGVICDFRLPNGHTAHDVLHHVMPHWGHLPTLIVSAEKLKSSDFDYHDTLELCVKPLHPDDLLLMLYGIMSNDNDDNDDNDDNKLST